MLLHISFIFSLVTAASLSSVIVTMISPCIKLGASFRDKLFAPSLHCYEQTSSWPCYLTYSLSLRLRSLLHRMVHQHFFSFHIFSVIDALISIAEQSLKQALIYRLRLEQSGGYICRYRYKRKETASDLETPVISNISIIPVSGALTIAAKYPRHCKGYDISGIYFFQSANSEHRTAYAPPMYAPRTSSGKNIPPGAPDPKHIDEKTNLKANITAILPRDIPAPARDSTRSCPLPKTCGYMKSYNSGDQKRYRDLYPAACTFYFAKQLLYFKCKPVIKGSRKSENDPQDDYHPVMLYRYRSCDLKSENRIASQYQRAQTVGSDRGSHNRHQQRYGKVFLCISSSENITPASGA